MALYREYRTLTREQALARGFDMIPLLGGYDARVARGLFESFPDVQRVDFCDPKHNTPKTRYVAPDDTIMVYVKSRWGRKARVHKGRTKLVTH